MTSGTSQTHDMRTAVTLAIRAPSLHNSQPWSWNLRRQTLELIADWRRQLAATDPDGHSLLMSCGAALELLRVGLSATGRSCEISRFPDPSQPALLARIEVGSAGPVDPATTRLAQAAARRRSDRGAIQNRPVEPELLWDLAGRAGRPGATAHVLENADDLITLTVFAWDATALEEADPGVQQELHDATHSHEGGGTEVPTAGIPGKTAEPRHLNIPQRDFGAGSLPLPEGADERPSYVVVASNEDSQRGWLEAGEVMMSFMVEAEYAGLITCPVSQSVDWPQARAHLRGLLNWPLHPQMILRVGWPAGPRDATSPSPRRPLSEVLHEDESPAGPSN